MYTLATYTPAAGTLLVQLQDALRALIYAQGHIQPSEVDVRFERPVEEWAESLTRPTISIYLHDMRENLELRMNGSVTPPVREGGRSMVRSPLRRFELYFLISALTTNVADEHALLWRTLNTLVRHTELPVSVLSDDLRALDGPLHLRVGRMIDGPPPMQIWSALRAPMRPSIMAAVVMPLERDEIFEVPLVLSRRVETTRPAPEREAAGLGLAPPRSNVLVSAAVDVGVRLRTPAGAPLAGAQVLIAGRAEALTADAEGQFVIDHARDGTYSLMVTPAGGAAQLVTLSVPSASYDLVVDCP
ncbi:MAG: hypothetical protein RLZZ387_4118 [Chloroflexota bacterium]|jgi:hypothetical protein